MYNEFARITKEEGFDDIARLFEGVAKVEKEHEERYRVLLEMLKLIKCLRRMKNRMGLS